MGRREIVFPRRRCPHLWLVNPHTRGLRSGDAFPLIHTRSINATTQRCQSMSEWANNLNTMSTFQSNPGEVGYLDSHPMMMEGSSHQSPFQSDATAAVALLIIWGCYAFRHLTTAVTHISKSTNPSMPTDYNTRSTRIVVGDWHSTLWFARPRVCLSVQTHPRSLSIW